LRAFHFLKRLADARHAGLAMHTGDFDPHITMLDDKIDQPMQQAANVQ
jgi:hypothetical protein